MERRGAAHVNLCYCCLVVALCRMREKADRSVRLDEDETLTGSLCKLTEKQTFCIK